MPKNGRDSASERVTETLESPSSPGYERRNLLRLRINVLTYSFIRFSTLELDNLEIRMFVKWHHAWARRIEHEGRVYVGPATDMNMSAFSGGSLTQEQYEGSYLRGSYTRY